MLSSNINEIKLHTRNLRNDSRNNLHILCRRKPIVAIMSQLPVRRRRTDNEPPAPSPPPRKKSRKNHHIVCHLCKMLFSEQGLQLLDSPRGLTHHSPADLETWSEGGCPICACFRVVVQENFGRDWESGGHLIFHNVYPESMKDQRDTHKPALHALKCSLENIEEHTAAMLYPFTKNGMNSASIGYPNTFH